jgi:hypothetical protein
VDARSWTWTGELGFKKPRILAFVCSRRHRRRRFHFQSLVTRPSIPLQQCPSLLTLGMILLNIVRYPLFSSFPLTNPPSVPSSSSGPPTRPQLNTNIPSVSSHHSPTTWLYSSPHHSHPHPSPLPLPPTSTSPSSMIAPTTPSFYDPDHALSHDSQNYHTWSDTYPQGGTAVVAGGAQQQQQQMGYSRGGTISHFSPTQQSHVPRSTADTVVSQPSPLQNQYHFVSGHYTPPPPPPSITTAGHYTVDARDSNYVSPSTRSSQQPTSPLQFQTTQHHDMYYYPTSISAELIPGGPSSSSGDQPSYTYSAAAPQQYQSPINPSPYTPASELSVTLPSQHSSASPASWTEEMPGSSAVLAGSGPSKRQPPYRQQQQQQQPLPQKRDRSGATKTNPSQSPSKAKSRKRARKSDPAGESGDSESDDESDAPPVNTPRGPEGLPTRL